MLHQQYRRAVAEEEPEVEAEPGRKRIGSKEYSGRFCEKVEREIVSPKHTDARETGACAVVGFLIETDTHSPHICTADAGSAFRPSTHGQNYISDTFFVRILEVMEFTRPIMAVAWHKPHVSTPRIFH